MKLHLAPGFPFYSISIRYVKREKKTRFSILFAEKEQQMPTILTILIRLPPLSEHLLRSAPARLLSQNTLSEVLRRTLKVCKTRILALVVQVAMFGRLEENLEAAASPVVFGLSFPDRSTTTPMAPFIAKLQAPVSGTVMPVHTINVVIQKSRRPWNLRPSQRRGLV